MKYSQNQYNQGFSICAFIVAGIFFYWGISAFLNIVWHFGFNWMGFVWFGLGAAIVGSQIAALVNRSKLRNIVLQEFHHNPNASVEDISGNTGISIKDVRSIILDLKAEGMLKGQILSSTEEAKSMKVIPKLEKEPISQERSRYCSNCGTPIGRENAAFCAYCGSKL
ncbi:MAG: zinc-ribbon domain-containing protein [Candidatus Odinarchaeota archaeon]